MVSRDKIAEIFSGASDDKVDTFYNTLTKYADVFLVKELVQYNFLLAQIVVETGNALDGKRENLNYSESSLKSTFSRYKSNPSWANRDGRNDAHTANQEMIGNVAYADRIGNGNIDSGDGYRFRGGGYFQLTGRANYSSITATINKLSNTSIKPEELEHIIIEPEMGLLSALAFWYNNKCYNCKDIDCVTKIVNANTDTYNERKKAYKWIATL